MQCLFFYQQGRQAFIFLLHYFKPKPAYPVVEFALFQVSLLSL